MGFSEKMDMLMENSGVKSLRKLANELSIPYTTLWDYYSNQERLEKANLMYIKKIAQYFGCTIDYLVYDDILIDNNVDNYKVKLQDKGLMDTKGNIVYGRLDKLMQIADLIEQYNDYN